MELLRKEVSSLTKVVFTQQDAIGALQKTVAEKSKQNVSYAATAATNVENTPRTEDNSAGRNEGIIRPAQSQHDNKRSSDPSERKKHSLNAGQKALNTASPDQKLSVGHHSLDR